MTSLISRSSFYKNPIQLQDAREILTTLSDKRRSVCNEELGIAFFEAEVLSQTDYYPFGAVMPDRQWSAGAEGYRYGFQGQEEDDEIKGEGNFINYRYRMHDTRLGRFFAVDPLTKEYPWYTPYQFSGNKVIHCIELEGLEEWEVNNIEGGNTKTFGPWKNQYIAQEQYIDNQYNSVDKSIDIETYNCYGLATRTYKYNSDLKGSVIPTLQAKSIKREDAKPGDVKVTLWIYDVHIEDSKGQVVVPPGQDFHIVGGQIGSHGYESFHVYSKNGARPIFGPGLGSDFKPAFIGPAETNDRNALTYIDEYGKPLIKLRSNMQEFIFYLPRNPK